MKQIGIIIYERSFHLPYISYYLLPCATYALLANFADIGISGLTRLTLFVSNFGELHHNELTMPSVLGIELHNGVCGCRTTTEKVENEIISIIIIDVQINEILDKISRLGEIENSLIP